MGLFENFPYTNLHDLNLDWILEEVKKLKEAGGYSPENPPPYPVTSVNGKTGAVVLFNEQEGVYVRFPDSENDQWNIYRLVNGVPAGIQFSATLPAKRMQGSNRFAIYDEGNPPPYPVTSVNGKTGAVVLFSDHDGAYIQFPDSNLSQWNVYRIIDEQTNGIQFHKNGAAVRMQGTNRYQIYDQGNPPPYPVTSVNGLTGAAETPFTDHTDDVLEFVAGAVGASWGLKRTINTGTADETDVTFTLQVNDGTGAPEAYIETGETVKKLLTEDDIPSSSGVVSVNGLTGVVTLTGANMPAAPGQAQTVGQAISAEAQTRQQADSSLNDNIAKLQEGIAIIVDGDMASVVVPVGGYAYVKNNTHGLADGLYKNTGSSAFPISGGTADSTVFTAVPEGGLNALNSNLTDNLSMYNLGIFSDMASLISAISTLENSLENNATRFVKFNVNTITDYWNQWEYHTGIVQKDDVNNWTGVFVGTSGNTLDIGSTGNYFSSKEENNKVSTLETSEIDFYGFTLGEAKAITATSYKRMGIAFGVWSTNIDSKKIIPFVVTIPANATTLTINKVTLYDVGEVTSGSYDVSIMTWRAS